MGICQYKSLFLCPIILLFVELSVAAAGRDLTVLASSDAEFHFVSSFDADPGSLNRLVNADSSVVFYRDVHVGVPAAAQAKLVTVEGRSPLTVDPEWIGSIRLTPVDALARVSDPLTIRGRKMVSVRIHPVAKSGLDGVCVYGEVEVHLVFERVRQSGHLAPADDPRFDGIFRAVFANYEAARSWPVVTRAASQTLSSAQPADNLAAAEAWYKITVNRTGLYQMTGAQLEAAGVSLTSLASDSIRIFNGGGLPNAIENYKDRPQFREIALLVLDGGDDVMNADDRIVFYGEAVDRWLYRTGFPAVYVNNRYTAENTYWLAVSGDFTEPAKRMGQLDGSPTGSADTVVTSFWRRAHIEQDNLVARVASGRNMDYHNWYWSDSTSLSLFVATPGALGGDSAHIYVDARTSGYASVNGYVDLIVNGTPAADKNCSSFNCRYTTYSLAGGEAVLNELRLQLDSVDVVAGLPPYFNFLQITYPGLLQPSNDRLDIILGNLAARAELQVVDNFSAVPTVFTISDPYEPTVVSGYQREGGTLAFEADLTVDGPNRFYCAVVSQAYSPMAITPAEFTDLCSSLHQTDLIVVTPKAFESHLDDYIDYREDDGWTIQVTAVEDIMDNFSYGLYDPTAIRDFLKFSYDSCPSPAPSAVLFAGDANYDFLNNLGTGVPNYVPSYVLPGDEFCGDDNYVYFGDYGILDGDVSYDTLIGDRGFDMMTARWPVRSEKEIDIIFAKMREYESPSCFGTWRTNVTLVADDEHAGDDHTQVFHARQTDSLSKYFVPRFLTSNKIYLWEYPFVNREKPDVNEAIVDAFNSGTLIVNYVGHGNPDVWAHEHVLERSTDIPQMINFARLPLVFVASCAIGFFDDPRREGMAEDLLSSPSGGAIGVISATRKVSSVDNASFNRAVYGSLFDDNYLSICEAMFAAKLQRQYPGPHSVDNDRAYVFMGDPCLSLALPRLDIEFSEAPDSLVALGVSGVRGRVVDESGEAFDGNGTLQVSVYDSDREKVYRLIDGTGSVTYTARYDVTGPTIYRGSASIINGSFDFEFITPLDIGYRGQGARISVYAVLDTIDGIGLADSIAVSEILAEVADSTGPEIEYAIGGRSNFVSGDAISQNESLQIVLSDPSGINLAGGLGHGIVLVTDGQTENATNLTSLFECEKDDFTTGRLTYGLEELAPGKHELKIKAWDNANNVSTAEFVVEVVASGSFALNDLLNYPNPMGVSTTFYFELTQPAERFSLEIFTLSGKNIWSFSRYGLQADNYPNDSFRVMWSGRDTDGDRVATGVYVYKATATSQDGGKRVEKLGKVVVLN